MKYSFLALLFALLVSCTSSDGVKDYREENEKEIAAYVAEHNLNAKRSASGLYYVIEEEGTGVQPNYLSDVTVYYKGYFTNGTVFDSSEDEWTSFSLQQTIAGFAEGLTYFNEGGKGMLLIPSHLAYGSNDYNGIPAGSVLIFEITLLSPEMIAEKNDEDIAAYIEKEGLNATKTESGLYYVIEEEGEGENPTVDSNVTIAYTGYFLNGTKFDQSTTEGITLKLNEVIKGWKEGIPYFKVGEKGKLLIPAHLAYGSYNYSKIPGGSVLIFDIELKSIND
jgi:FKBP-type peptidyl-prolyl cis-trans isomerase